MKWITIILIFVKSPIIAQDTTLIWAEVNESCALRPHPTYGTLDVVQHMLKGEECIIMDVVKEQGQSYDSYWWYVITLEGKTGYLMKGYIDKPDSLFNALKDSKDFELRTRIAKEYYRSNASRLSDTAARRKARRLEAVKEKIKATEDILSKDHMLLDYQDFSNILDYVNWRVIAYNTNKSKTVKYIWFTVTAINPVNDPIQSKTFKAIGPIAPFKTSEYIFENAFISRVVDHCVIKSVKIQYMDLTTITLTGKQIKNTDLSRLRAYE